MVGGVKQAFHYQRIGAPVSSPPDAPSTVERRPARAYAPEFVPGAVGYVVTIPLAILLGDTQGEIGCTNR